VAGNEPGDRVPVALLAEVLKPEPVRIVAGEKDRRRLVAASWIAEMLE
jgi:hypothetical protein